MPTYTRAMGAVLQAWEAWLAKHHTSSAGLWLRLAKKWADQPTAAYAEALEVALCYGRFDEQKKAGAEEPWLPMGADLTRAKGDVSLLFGKVRPDVRAVMRPALYERLVDMNTQNDRNQAIIDEFRANGGRVGGPFAGRTLLLLHTLGAKSGQPRVNPVACLRDGERLVIIASKGGAPTNPDWYYNLVAHPLVTVEVGMEQFQARATIAVEPERTRLYDAMVVEMPGFADYQRHTARVIPVISLTRTA